MKIYKNQKKKLYEFSLSEILFTFDVSFNEVNEFIKSMVSRVLQLSLVFDTSSKGGEIGWVKLTNLSKEFQEKIYSLKVGEYTEPIKIPSGNLILKLNSKKKLRINLIWIKRQKTNHF